MPPLRTLQLHACDATTGWTAVADRDTTALATDTVNFQEGTASLKLGVDTTGSSSNNWAEYYFTTSATDVGNYDYLQFYIKIEDATTLGRISFMLIDMVFDADYEDFFSWQIEQSDLAVGWNTMRLYFNQSTFTYGTPDRSTFQKLTVHIHHLGTSITAGNILVDDFKVADNLESKYDIKIDGQGYMLLQDGEGAYSQTDHPYQHDRFSTGDVELSDFNFYQYQAQTDWSHGFQEKYLSGEQPSVFWDGNYIDHSHIGELRMHPKRALVSASGNSGVVTGIETYKGSAFISVVNTPTSWVYSWPGSGNALTLSNTLTSKTQVWDLEKYNDKLYVSTGVGGTVYQFDGSTWSGLTQTATFMGVLGDTLYAGKLNAMLSYDGSTWTEEYAHTGLYIGDMVTWRDKIYYLATDDAQHYRDGSKASLFYWDGVDRVEIQQFDEAAKTSIEYWNNRLWFIVGNVLYSFDGEALVEELDLLDADGNSLGSDTLGISTFSTFENGIGKGLKRIGKKLYMVLNSASTSKLLVNPGYGWAPALGDHTAFYTTLGVLERNNNSGDSVMLGDQAGNVYRIDEDAFDTAATSHVESSWIDMDLPNVQKMFRSMAFQCEDLPAGSTVHMYYKLDDDSNSWTTLTFTNIAGETFVENQFPSSTVGKRIKYKIELSNSVGTATPRVNDIIIKYIIAPDTKKRWTVGIVLSDEVVLLDGKRETKNARELRAALWESRKKKQVVEFQDTDGSVYDVLMNDLQVRSPGSLKTQIQDGEGPEFHAFIELIED